MCEAESMSEGISTATGPKGGEIAIDTARKMILGISPTVVGAKVALVTGFRMLKLSTS